MQTDEQAIQQWKEMQGVVIPDARFEDFEASKSVGKLMEALAKAQGAMPAPVKNKKNPHFNSAYADHASVIECSKPHLAANGLAISQGVGFKDERVIITTLLGHSSGEWIRSRLSIRPDKPTAQGIGSATTYGRRYGHCAILNMAPDDDDDGNQASPAPKGRPEIRHEPEPNSEPVFDPDNKDWAQRIHRLCTECGLTDETEISRITRALKGIPISGVRAKLQELTNGAVK